MRISDDAFCIELNSQDSAIRVREQMYSGIIESCIGEQTPAHFWLLGIKTFKKTPMGRTREKVLVEYEKLYWVDVITHSIYDPYTKHCMSSNQLWLTGHPVESERKKLLRPGRRTEDKKYY